MSKNDPFNSCLICGSANLRGITTNINFGINIVQCSACNFVQSEFVSDRALELYYANFYRGQLDAPAMAGQREKGLRQARGQMAYLLERRPGLKIAAALDYGTAEGSLGHELCAIADKVWVTEMDPQFVALLKNDPLLTLIEHKDLASGAFDASFDLVCISHVLEHLTDPYQAMDMFASVLKPGGLLLVDIPNECACSSAASRRKATCPTSPWIRSGDSSTCMAHSISSRSAPATARSICSSRAAIRRRSNTTFRSPRTAPRSGPCCRAGRRRRGGRSAAMRSTKERCSTNTAGGCWPSTSCSKPPKRGSSSSSWSCARRSTRAGARKSPARSSVPKAAMS